MAFESIGDILDRAAEFESKLERYYAAIRDESQDNGVRLLTYYFSRHRNHLADALKGFDSGKIQRIRKVKLKYNVDFDPEKAFHLLKTSPKEVRGMELLETAVEYDEELVALYKKLRDQPIGPEAIVLVESLIRVEEKDIVMIKKMIAMNYF
jgi:hypothetical protein